MAHYDGTVPDRDARDRHSCFVRTCVARGGSGSFSDAMGSVRAASRALKCATGEIHDVRIASDFDDRGNMVQQRISTAVDKIPGRRADSPVPCAESERALLDQTA